MKETHTATAVYDKPLPSGSYNLYSLQNPNGFKVPMPRLGIVLPIQGSDKYGWRSADLIDDFLKPTRKKFNKGEIAVSGRLKTNIKPPKPKTSSYLANYFNGMDLPDPDDFDDDDKNPYENMDPLELLEMLKKTTTNTAELNRYTHLTNYFTRMKYLKTQRPLTQTETALYESTLENLYDEMKHGVNPLIVPAPVAPNAPAPPGILPGIPPPPPPPPPPPHIPGAVAAVIPGAVAGAAGAVLPGAGGVAAVIPGGAVAGAVAAVIRAVAGAAGIVIPGGIAKAVVKQPPPPPNKQGAVVIHGAAPPVVDKMEDGILRAATLKVITLYKNGEIAKNDYDFLENKYLKPLDAGMNVIQADITNIASMQDFQDVNIKIADLNSEIADLVALINGIEARLNAQAKVAQPKVIPVSGVRGTYPVKFAQDFDSAKIQYFYNETVRRRDELLNIVKGFSLFQSPQKISVAMKNKRDEIVKNLIIKGGNVVQFNTQLDKLTAAVFLDGIIGAGNRSLAADVMRFYLLFNERKNNADDLLTISRTDILPVNFQTTQIS